jgi:hypothetical protein
MMNDLEVIALVVPMAAILLYVFRPRVHDAWHSLLVLERSSSREKKWGGRP